MRKIRPSPGIGWRLGVALFFLFALGRSGATNGGDLSLGVCIMGAAGSFYLDIAENIKKAGAPAGVTTLIRDGNYNNDSQAEIIDEFIAKKTSLILISPFNSRDIIPALERAGAAGIPVMTIDSDSEWPGVIANCASDNLAGGRLGAGVMLERLAEKGVVDGDILLLTHEGVNTTAERLKGFADVFNLRGGNFNLRTADAAGNRGRALEEMRASIKAAPKLAAVFAANHSMTMGAVAALREAGLLGKVAVVGYDQPDDLDREMAADEIAGILVQFPDRLGEAAFRLAHDYLSGKNRTPDRRIRVEVGIHTSEGLLDQRGNLLKKR